MKIFDFSNGTKGDELGNVRFGFTGNCMINGVPHEISSKIHGCTVDFHNDFGWDDPITPEQYGVEALCFCIGKDEYNNTWMWGAVGTPQWITQAIQTKILVPKGANA